MLNTFLYNRLCERFEKVKVVHEGVENVGEYRHDPMRDRTRFYITTWGEGYRVVCPFCGDPEQTLLINHDYGIFDQQTGSNNCNLCHCFHKNCLKAVPGRYRELQDMIFGFRNPPNRMAAAGKAK